MVSDELRTGVTNHPSVGIKGSNVCFWRKTARRQGYSFMPVEILDAINAGTDSFSYIARVIMYMVI